MDSKRDIKLAGLLKQAQHGDQVAYEAFLTETADILRRFLAKRMDHDMIEDVLQDTLLAVHRFLNTYSPGRPVGPWLYAICSNRMSDHYRAKRRIQRIESGIDVNDRTVAETEHRDHSFPGNAIDALKRIPERQRHIIKLLKIYGLSIKETATHTGMSESAVKITAHRGYEAIRKLLGIK